MVVCVSYLFMPSPYMTTTWIFILGFFLVLAGLVVCVMKCCVKDVMFADHQKECDEWNEYLLEVKQKEVEKIKKNKKKQLSSRTKSSNGTPRDARDEPDEDYTPAPEDDRRD